MGFPTSHRTNKKAAFGFQTGDIIKAIKPKGKGAGVLIGRVTIRQTPSFKVNGVDVHPKYCRIIQNADGYSYAFV